MSNLQVTDCPKELSSLSTKELSTENNSENITLEKTRQVAINTFDNLMKDLYAEFYEIKTDKEQSSYKEKVHRCTEQVLKLRTQGVDINDAFCLFEPGACFNFPHPWLHWASTSNNVELTKMLINSGADIHSVGHDNYTALHEAITHNNKELFDFLLDHGADIHTKTKHTLSSLHLAAKHGSLEIAQSLLEKGLPVDELGGSLLFFTDYKSKNEKKACTPLTLAVQHGQLDLAALLLKHKANIHITDAKGNTLIHKATKKGQKESVAFLIEQGLDIHAKNNDGHNALDKALKAQNPDLITYLSKQGGLDVNAKDKNGHTLLHREVQKNYVNTNDLLSLETIECLLKNGADVNARDNKGNTALHLIIDRYCSKSKKVVAVLAQHGADMNARNNNGDSPLDKLTYNSTFVSNHVVNLKHYIKELATALIENGADVNAQDSEGNTVIHKSCLRNSILLVNRCLSRLTKIDFSILNNEGDTAIHTILKYRTAGLLGLILLRGNLRAPNKNGETALHICLREDDKQIIKAALHKAREKDLNFPDPEGKTALHIAVEMNLSKKKISSMIQKGADIHKKDHAGNTALQIASNNNNAELVALLTDPESNN